MSGNEYVVYCVEQEGDQVVNVGFINVRAPGYDASWKPEAGRTRPQWALVASRSHVEEMMSSGDRFYTEDGGERRYLGDDPAGLDGLDGLVGC
jgi:hypothetical protein